MAPPGVRALDPEKSTDQYVHRHWGVEEGFVGGQVYAIAQSADGFLWAGTDRGLARFDGRAFALIQRPIAGQPAVGRVRQLLLDRDGTLWIRTEEARLLLYRDGTFRDAFTAFPMEETTFTAMAKDRTGHVLLTGLGRSAIRYTGRGFQTVANALDIPGTVTAMTESRDGRIWMGTRDAGLYVLRNGQLTSGATALEGQKINALLPAHNGGLWVGTDHGVVLLLMGGALHRPQDPAGRRQILTLASDSNGNVWAGTSSGLLRISSPQATRARDDESGSVQAIFEDSDGTLWYGGKNGLECLRDGVFTRYGDGTRHNALRTGAVYADAKGRIWFAPVDGGLRVLEKGRVQTIPLDGPANDVVYSISGGGEDIWVGRQKGGLTRLRMRGGKWTASRAGPPAGVTEKNVFSVLRTADGAVWEGTLSAGLTVLRGAKTQTFTQANGFLSNAVNALAEGKDGTIWAATPAGLGAYRNGAWRRWGTPDGLPSADVRTCFVDSGGVLWAGTAEGLVAIGKDRIARRAMPDVLREQSLGIAEDRFGFLWFSTADHLLRAPREALLAGTLREADMQIYRAGDGVPESSEARRDRTLVNDAAGRIWIAIDGGVAMADSAPRYRDTVGVPVRIESLLSSGEEYPAHNSPALPPGRKDVSIRFEGVALSAPDRVRYRYKLDGVDNDWSQPVANREIRYSNLAPGSYRFHVIASRDGTLWNAEESAFAFSIARAFWQTWWFRAAAIATLAALVLLWLRLRTLTLSRHLSARFQERLNERTRIAQELHDTLLQSFQGLMLRFQTADTLLPERPVEAKAALSGALSRADEALRESRNAIEGMRGAADREVDLADALNAMMREGREYHDPALGQAPESSVIVEGMPRPLSPPACADIDRIAREAIRNCYQHSGAQRIEAEAVFGRRWLRLSVRDDGAGIDPAVLNRGSRTGHWGLIGMRERAERLNARINIYSRPGAGTEVELRVPAEIAYEKHRTGRAQWPASRGRGGLHDA